MGIRSSIEESHLLQLAYEALAGDQLSRGKAPDVSRTHNPVANLANIVEASENGVR